MGAYDGMNIGKKIAMLRDRVGNISQTDLGERLGVSQAQVSLWERGANAPKLAHALAMARLFGVPLDYLADDDLDDPPGPPMTAEEAYVLRVFRNAGVSADEAARRIIAPAPSGQLSPMAPRELSADGSRPAPAASSIGGRAGPRRG